MNNVNRESLSSTGSDYSDDEHNQINCLNLKEKGFSWAQQLLFCGPLILCLILLIIGIVIFIIVEQRNRKNQEFDLQFANDAWNTALDDISPISCSARPRGDYENLRFIWHECACALSRSLIFEIIFEPHHILKYPGEHISTNYLINSPKVYLNQKYLSKIRTQSFLLIVLPSNDNYYGRYTVHLPPYWIKYYSLSSNQMQDICENILVYSREEEERKVFLLYATNSSQTMIRAKTYCNSYLDVFSLIDYVELFKLKLIASTYFQLITTLLED